MDSMSDAMKVALEHPIPEPPHRPRVMWKRKASVTKKERGERLAWCLACIGGSITAAVALMLMSGKRQSSWESRRQGALAAMDFGGD